MINKKLVVYGLGATGMRVVDELLAHGVDLGFILDKNKAGTTYAGLNVLGPDDVSALKCQEYVCLVTLHNHYVDIHQIHDQLAALGFSKISSLVNLPSLCPEFGFSPGYWLNFNVDMAAYAQDLEEFLGLLDDAKSMELARSIIEYRKNGQIAQCPPPQFV